MQWHTRALTYAHKPTNAHTHSYVERVYEPRNSMYRVKEIEKPYIEVDRRIWGPRVWIRSLLDVWRQQVNGKGVFPCLRQFVWLLNARKYRWIAGIPLNRHIEGAWYTLHASFSVTLCPFPSQRFEWFHRAPWRRRESRESPGAHQICQTRVSREYKSHVINRAPMKPIIKASARISRRRIFAEASIKRGTWFDRSF